MGVRVVPASTTLVASQLHSLTVKLKVELATQLLSSSLVLAKGAAADACVALGSAGVWACMRMAARSCTRMCVLMGC